MFQPDPRLCQAIERDLMSVLGIESYKTSPLTSSVLIIYDRRQLKKEQLIEILARCLAKDPAARARAIVRPRPWRRLRLL